MQGKLLFAQSGGPTAVINASAYGVIKEAQKHDNITHILGARYGIEGVLHEDWIDLSTVDQHEIDLLQYTPSSAFGSCRYKLPTLANDDGTYGKILDIFQRNNIRYFVYIGGNDSMDTCNKLAHYMQDNHYQCNIVGVPKTVDNDLMATDHCPGYGSAGKYIATTIHEIALDAQVYKKGRITIVEIMGRHAGWLTAMSALATNHGAGPDLVYLPERPFDIDSFAQKCKDIWLQKGHCVVAVSEGIKYADNTYVASTTAVTNDKFGHHQLGGVGAVLANYLTTQHQLPTRAIELSLSQRCASHIASLTDCQEAYNVGVYATCNALNGANNIMAGMKRVSNSPYDIEYYSADLDTIANAIKYMPDDYINEDGTFVTDQFVQYALPLIQGETTVSYHNGLPVYSKITAK